MILHLLVLLLFLKEIFCLIAFLFVCRLGISQNLEVEIQDCSGLFKVSWCKFVPLIVMLNFIIV